jgi:hexosaminidase
MRKISLPLFFLLSFIIVSDVKAKENTAPLIPFPEKVEWLEGKFLLSNETGINVKSNELYRYFISKVNELTGLNFTLKYKPDLNNEVIIKIDSSLGGSNKEFYLLTVSEHIIEIASSFEEGLFRGMQTFFQLIPASVKTVKNGSTVDIPCCKITDKPAFKWRGLNLDCTRHFMTKEFIKQYVDILAYYKFNILHLHLTDDQGWRIEIKKYPKLSQVGSLRKETDGSLYGGYYTQYEIKEIIDYAKSRFITVVPEIEMPGHCLASLAAYPENSCTGGPFEVTNKWGVFNDVYCAGRDSTFYFLENILDEVMELFPGKYIHIGGDEVPKDRWKACPRCLARIKAEGLKNEEELQSYFVKRISEYLNSKGKDVIGWDEILQGGLAPGAVVESWQGMQGAIEAAKLKHYSICSPFAYTYLSNDIESLDLHLTYLYEPVPPGLPADEKKYILGGEASLWTEETLQNEVDGKLFPRLLALSEVFWTNSKNKDYEEFHSRVRKVYNDLTAVGIQYGQESKAISFSSSYNALRKEFMVNITLGQEEFIIHYTINGSEPDSTSAIYNAPVKIIKPSELKISAYMNGHFTGKKIDLLFDFHKAVNAKLTLTERYDDQYRACGDETLIDGIRGSNDFHDGLWQGFYGVDFEGIIDLGKEKNISEVIPRFLSDSNSWIFLPASVEISLSDDGKNYSDAKVIENDIPEKNPEILFKDYKASYDNRSARYIKVFAKSIKQCPAWHPAVGEKAWLFIDEIEVN